MRMPFPRPRCVSFFLFLCLFCAPVTDAQETTPDSEIYVPNSAIIIPAKGAEPVYQDVIRLAKLPTLNIPAPASHSTPPPVSDPVALVNYEAPEEDKSQGQTAPPISTGSPLNDDPIFTFGGLLPVDEQSVDRWKLSRLQETYDELNSQLGETSEPNESVKETLTIAAEWIRSGGSNLDRIERLKQETLDQPKHLKQLEEAIQKPLPSLPANLDQDTTLESYQSLLLEYRGQEQRLNHEFDAAESLIRERSQQISTHAKLETQLNEKLTKSKENIDNHQGNNLLLDTRLLESRAIEAGAKINLRLLATEAKWLSATEKSTFLQRDWLKRQLENVQGITQNLTQQVAQLQDEKIKAEAESAHRDAMHAHPLLRGLAEEIAILADQRTKVSEINRANVTEQQGLDQHLSAIQSSRKKLDEHLAAAGHSQAVGLLLRF
ncbi:MAG: hypothetical protein P8J33_09005, partial [Pirellulaceae bacterium]|nr:hypothetical protein [Pirellulaceae bacterium]